MNRFIPLFIWAICLFFSCGQQKNQENHSGSNRYARGFHIEKKGDIIRLDVFNPWENADNYRFTYYLVNRNLEIPDSLRNKQLIRIPVQRVVVLSTTHIGFLEKLGMDSTVVAVSGKKYVSNEVIRDRIDRGIVKDVGYDRNLNYELLTHLQPDLVMAYGIGSEVATHISKMKDLGIPVVINAEYLEETPLGRAEWLIFVASFFDKMDEAGRIFNKIVVEYDRLKTLADEAVHYPGVMTGLPYKENWWVPGGNSYMANLIADAGGDYIWKENDSRESFVVSLENVIVNANRAEYWINCGQVNSIRDILETDERFGIIPSLKAGHVYNDNKRMSGSGGNEVWETGVANPQLILNDLIHIFHPELKTDEELYYYQPMH